MARSVIVWLALSCAVGARAQTRETICEVQDYDAQGLSPLQGQVVTVAGGVTFPPGYVAPYYTSFYIERDNCGVNVFGYELLSGPPALGDSVVVTGVVEEYISSSGAGATTQIVIAEQGDVEIISTANPAPEPTDMDLASIQVEDNEGRLLRALGVVVETNYDWLLELSDGFTTLSIYRAFNDSVSFASYDIGDTLRITGILFQYDRSPPYLEGYELVPRFQSDIVRWEGTPVHGSSWGRIKALYRM
jgi:hypothetical protein